MRRTSFYFCALVTFTSICAVGQSPEQRTASYFETIRKSPPQLEAFLRAMPKGGDLHNHLIGAAYAESYIQLAANDKLCIDRKTLGFVQPPCDSSHETIPAETAFTDAALYRAMIHALSMRDFHPYSQPDVSESGEDHFFATFGRFVVVANAHMGELLAEVAWRAGHQNESYLELTLGLDHAAMALGSKVGWSDNFDEMGTKLNAAGIEVAVHDVRKALDGAEAQKNKLLNCDDPAHADAGCKVTIRYIHEVLRAMPKEQVFAQAMLGFLLANSDHRYVSVNPVQPEDDYISMRDYKLHMRIFGYFHNLYPKVHLTEHAGELAPGLVPPDGLRFHIREAVEVGHAQRIGHGVDVTQEDRPDDLLREMAAKHVAVEICLTSNDLILGVKGDRHPFPVYRKFGVPVVLATDDEGVSRIDLTHEYLRAVLDYGLTYADLKKLVQDSIEYSFADPGEKNGLRLDLEARFTGFESVSHGSPVSVAAACDSDVNRIPCAGNLSANFFP
jgi:hypothetical protein